MKPGELARFATKHKRVGECDIWQASHDENGYGWFWVGGRMRTAHRASFEHFVGPVPAGLELDHLCRTRDCVRVDHLEPVSHRVNVLRGIAPSARNARKTRCIRGHALSGDNLLIRQGDRHCWTCKRDRDDRERKSGRYTEYQRAYQREYNLTHRAHLQELQNIRRRAAAA